MVVSVLMCIYKERTEFLRKSIESILSQTYKDFEFIIVGDTPLSDRYRVFSVVKEYASKDSRIRFYPNEDNIGFTKSLNIGLSHCCGKYIARMDADDISLPTRLEKQIAFMEANPTILSSGAWVECIDENGEKTGEVWWKSITDSRLMRLMMFYHNCIGHPISIFHRVINGNPVLYDETAKYAQDYVLWTDLLQYGELANLPEILLQYRRTPEQISTLHLSEQQGYAIIAQKRMFLLYDFPQIESFFKVFHQLTIKNNHSIPLDKAKHEFQLFVKETNLTKNNEEILEHLIWFFLKVYSGHFHRRTAFYLYSTTKSKPLLTMKMEAQYIKMCVIRIIKKLKAMFCLLWSE